MLLISSNCMNLASYEAEEDAVIKEVNEDSSSDEGTPRNDENDDDDDDDQTGGGLTTH